MLETNANLDFIFICLAFMLSCEKCLGNWVDDSLNATKCVLNEAVCITVDTSMDINKKENMDKESADNISF